LGSPIKTLAYLDFQVSPKGLLLLLLLLLCLLSRDGDIGWMRH
jgi:hypothetical protein